MNKFEVKNLEFKYSSKHITLENISFTLNAGETLSIIGRNGSGKSTLAKNLIGLLKPTGGQIFLDDIEFNSKNLSKIRTKIGIVFQNPDNQFIATNVRDDIAFGLENKCIPQSQMEPIIEKFSSLVRMDKFLDKEPHNLSGGQKQRVAIAGVLALNPEILILDEATSMLDPVGVNEVNNAIDIVKKENPNLAIISITHNLKEALKSNKILVLDRGGKLSFFGTPSELLSHRDILINSGFTLPLEIKFKDEILESDFYKKNQDTIDMILEDL